MPRPWRLPEPLDDIPLALREAVGGHPLVARLLAQRGMADPLAARAFLDPAQYRPAPPAELPGLPEAVRLLGEAAASGGAVYVWGDGDADGITATALLHEALAAAGLRVTCGLPARAEGPGLPPRAVQAALAAGAQFLVTCDTGVTAHETVSLARRLGLRVIITDHHDLPEALPAADALVNPRLLPGGHPLAGLSGVGVAYLLAQGLAESGASALAGALDGLLDLAAIGLVADLAPLTDDVRYLVQRGLQALRYTQRPGLLALLAAAEASAAHADEETISWLLGPRLNAAADLAGSEAGLRLLLTADAEEAADLAGLLERKYRERRARTEAALAAAEEQLRRDPELQAQPAIVVEAGEWGGGGVLGRVAAGLAERYDRPAVVIALHADGLCVGSARSVEGVDIHEAISAGRDLLVREGGHPLAAGFTVRSENLPRFRSLLMRALAPVVAARPVAPLRVDAIVAAEAIDLALARELSRLGPFGAGNPRAVLALPALALARLEAGDEQAPRYRRLYLSGGEGQSLRVTTFGEGALPAMGARVDVAVHVRAAFWGGQERLDVLLAGWRPAEEGAPATVTLAEGAVEVVDWRGERRQVETLLQTLRERYGERLAVWAEGPEVPEGALRRADLPEQGAPALALASAPAGPEDLRAALARVRPHVVYLLPPADTAAREVRAFLRQVAGMLQVTLRDRAGHLDVPRMASRVGQREAAILAALRALEADGHLRLTRGVGGAWRAEPGAGRTSSAERRRRALLVVEEVLAETAAYRQAYATMPPAALFSRPAD
ncbi:MAG: hypothetical protein GX657_07960 [Chloroflexi bacterium]|nr:hypothetical protein [Chloroflexota bacterium]